MKGRYYKIANIASVVWLVGVVGVITIIALASKFMTHDPDFSPGDPENVYLLPMLSFFFVGGFAFVVMIVSWLVARFTKGQKPSHDRILGLSVGRSTILAGIVLFASFAFLFGMRQKNIGAYSQESTAKVTGQEVFDAVNNYRKTKGLPLFKLDPRICDNLVQRYYDIVNPDNKYVGHAGFEKWIKTEGLQDEYDLAEVYVTNIGAGSDAVKFWQSSPGHNSAVLGEYKLGCAYANQGVAVMILGNKR
jgi:hypothetical protein